MINFWDANTYSKFLDARTRPARDLLVAIPNTITPEIIYDLGCGPGNSTIILKQRWPNANVTGVDSSSDMLEQARSLYHDIEFTEGDIATFACDTGIDILFANASLQWLSQHEQVFPKLTQLLNPNGILAVQIPNNFHAPSHQVTISILQNHPAWAPYLDKLRYGALTKPFYQPSWYYNLLTSAGLTKLQIWQTEYFQELENHQAVFDWVKGTGLRPVLSAMQPEEQKLFAKHYIEQIVKYYPLQPNGKVIFPFMRLFMVGEASSS